MTILVLAALVAASAAAPAHDMAQHDMARHEMRSMHMPGTTGVLHESGQSEFAAIAEATRMLEADPHTDWSKVNIDALRAHLVDMDNVTVRSDVVTTPVENGARFAVTSPDPKVRDSISRMLRMHSGMANQEGPYRVAIEDIAGGVAMTVVGKSSEDGAKIRGLGFFGLLTEGVHHQTHHLMLARGEPMHH